MPQTLTTAPPSQSIEPSREIQATTTPITNLPTPAAQALSIANPLLLTLYFYLRFGALVVDPVSTLLVDLAPLSVIQCAYAVICLPLSKRSATADHAKSTTSSKSKSSKGKAPGGAQNEVDAGTKISNALLSLLLSASAIIPIFILLVLFGAPLTTHHSQTLLCAAHFSLLAIFPLFYTHGVDRQAWWEIGGAMLPFDCVWGATIGTAVGAWLGAVPIPLDWDREWQKWPVTIVAGMYIGAMLGNFAGQHLLYGKRLRFRPSIEEDKIDMKKKA